MDLITVIGVTMGKRQTLMIQRTELHDALKSLAQGCNELTPKYQESKETPNPNRIESIKEVLRVRAIVETSIEAKGLSFESKGSTPTTDLLQVQVNLLQAGLKQLQGAVLTEGDNIPGAWNLLFWQVSTGSNLKGLMSDLVNDMSDDARTEAKQTYSDFLEAHPKVDPEQEPTATAAI